MKNIVAIGILFLTFNAFSQRVVDKAVGDFNEIKVYDLIEVKLIKSDENRVVVKGDKADDLQVINKNGVLKLRMQLDKKFSGEDTFVEVHFSELDLIDGNEGSKINLAASLEQSKIELKTQEGAKITAKLDVENVVVRAVTGGVVEVSGKTRFEDVVLNTGGVFLGKDLKSEMANIKITAAGEANINATEKVDINIRIGGDVNVHGNPKEINQNTFAGGRVKIIK
ncbi:head GIN domain-containing protein [Arenibacter nanhaiticus]|nr:head GIN domain-containing protein [Arenibacter nanhaiticus]